jgi:hypothetical protein
MFLPNYLMKGVDSSVHSNNILLNKKVIYNAGIEEKKSQNRPLYIFSALALFAILISLLKNKLAQRITVILDITLLFTVSLVGFFLLFMWFGTNHIACSANYNLLWALPVHIITITGMRRKSQWWLTYIKILAILYSLLLLGWAWLPQQLNPALVPVCIWLLWCLIRFSKKSHA